MRDWFRIARDHRAPPHWVIVATMVAIAVVIRLHRFGAVPPGVNIDEASGAYDAWAVWRYGIDRAGHRFPVIFDAFGTGQQPLVYYLTIPFVALFGFHLWAIRLPALLLNVGALPAFYAIGRQAVDRRFGLLCLFLLAIAPWHLVYSRWTHELTAFPAAFLLAMAVLVRSASRPRWFPLAMLLLGLNLYVYGPAPVVVPPTVVLAGAFLFHRRRLGLQTLLGGWLLFAVAALPIGLFYLVNQLELGTIVTPLLTIPRVSGIPRFRTVTAVTPGAMMENLGTLWSLLLHQQDGLAWSALPGYGTYYLFTPGIALIGLVGLLAEGRRGRLADASALMLIWGLSAVVLAAVVQVNLNRIAVLFPVIVFLAAAGIRMLPARYFVRTGIVCLYAIASVTMTRAYFATYPERAARAFNATFLEALDDAIGRVGGHDLICVTDEINVYRLAYVYALFAERTDPRLFRATAQLANPGEEFQSVTSFGRFRFGIERCRDLRPAVYVLHPREERLLAEIPLVRHRVGAFVVATPRDAP